MLTIITLKNSTFLKMTSNILTSPNLQPTKYVEVRQDLNEDKCNENKKKQEIFLNNLPKISLCVQKYDHFIKVQACYHRNKVCIHLQYKKLASKFFTFSCKKNSKQTIDEQPPEEKVIQTYIQSKKQRSDQLSNNDIELSAGSKNDDDSLEHKNSDSHNTQKTEIKTKKTHTSIFPNLEDENVSAVLYGVKSNIFFKTRQSLVDLINEQHIITCFQNDSQWKNDPNILDNEKYCQLFFAFNLKFKLYLTVMLTLVDLPWILGNVDSTINSILLKTIRLKNFYLCNYN
ncbi:hypothetical protein RFI_25820 [Reticulomyxa filosa]|uniref:Uncharacterized protein n=1 Tax=Reticulomyxa filosa TaxID=46433 RepID=X6MD07_RETFI|nr:hypothetical protein RFI_25820 [Reticulomyxa filosa]|eukprot:ETO11556.1 hypothetical protein RFI_25820 [Reticulomyxa filosa]